MSGRRWGAALGLLFALALPTWEGCSLLPELLRIAPVEVLDYRPEQELVDPQSVPCIWVRFSSAMNRTAAEEAFSLQEGSDTREGRFAWEEGDRRLVFTPLVPLAAGRLYTVALSAAAEDRDGNCLAEPLRFQFRTGADDQPPTVLSLLPPDGSLVPSPREPIVIAFSEPMDAASVYAGLSLFPAVPGCFSWREAGREVVFQPLKDYDSDTEYSIILRGSSTDRSGNPIGEEYRSHFRTATEPEPEVLGVVAEGGGRALEPVSAGVALNRDLGIEKDECLRVSFSHPVPPAERGSALSLEPSATLSLRWSEGPPCCLVEFPDYLEWDRVYTLTVLEEEFVFLVDGPRSRPPRVEAVKLCLGIGEPEPVEFVSLEYGGNYSFGDGSVADAAFDVHLAHAEAARIDLGSFLDALSVSITGGCVDLQWHEAAVNPVAPAPQPTPGPGRSVVRLRCSLADDPTAAGTLAIRLSAKFRDNLDNQAAGEFALLVNNNTPPGPEAPSQAEP